MIRETIETRTWSSGSVMDVCIKNNLCDRCSPEVYDKLLNFVDEFEPTNENVHFVAGMIYATSPDQTLTNVLFIIENYAVRRHYDIVDRLTGEVVER